MSVRGRHDVSATWALNPLLNSCGKRAQHVSGRAWHTVGSMEGALAVFIIVLLLLPWLLIECPSPILRVPLWRFTLFIMFAYFFG